MKWEYGRLVATYRRTDNAPPGPQKWEGTFWFQDPAGSREIESADSDIVAVVNDLGQGGWETWHMESSGNSYNSQHSIWFKRPIPNP